MSREITVRCLNCLNRIPVQPNAEKVTCPTCRITFRLSWARPGQPKIRGRA